MNRKHKRRRELQNQLSKKEAEVVKMEIKRGLARIRT